jgi:hypothetical protein
MTNNTFSRESLLKKQKDQQEAMEKQREELRKTIKTVADTDSGLKLLQYLFLMCGGNAYTVRRNKDRAVDLNETLVTAAIKSVWEDLRINMDQETISKIERNFWEN